MNKAGLHFENSNLDKYDIYRNKHADEKDSGKHKFVCSITILPVTGISGNAHEGLKISFEDSYDDYDDDSFNVTVTEHSSRDKVNSNESLSKFNEKKLKNINRVITAQRNVNSLQDEFDFLKETVTCEVGIPKVGLITESKLNNSFPTAQLQTKQFILFMHLTNGTQFLNVTSLSLASTHLAAPSAPAPVIVILPFTSMYASE